MASSSLGSAYAPWDVVIVPFPYTDRTAQKRRPALVVSTKQLHDQHGLTWLVMITSAGNRGWSGDVALTDLARTGLSAASVVRPAKIATVETAHILKRIGTLGATDRQDVLRSLDGYMPRT